MQNRSPLARPWLFGVLVLCLGSCGSDPASSSGGSGGTGGTGGTGGGGAAGGGTAGEGGAGAGTVGSGGSGGSTGSGGTGAGAGAGGSGTGGNPGVSCADLPLCDGFEGAAAGGPPSPATWSVGAPNCSGTGSLTVDGEVAHSGSKSVRIDGKGGYCNHVFFGNAAAISAIGKVVYGRMFVRFEDALGQGHTTFLAMKDAADGGKDLRMGGQNDILMYNRESDDATLPVLSPAGTALSKAPAPGAWTCIEFRIDGDQGTIGTWVDGAEVTGLIVDGTATPDVDQQWITQKPGWKPDLKDFRLGWESYAGQDMTLWIDDVALAKDKIGCQ